MFALLVALTLVDPLLLLTGESLGQESPVRIQTTSGTQHDGVISEFDIDVMNVQTANGDVSFAYEQIETIVFGGQAQPPDASTVSLRLVDGSALNVKSFSISSQNVSAQLQCDVTAIIRTRDVEYIRMKSYENELVLAKQWKQLLADDSREGDSIVVNRSGELDTVDGIIGDLTEDKLTFSIEDRTARVPLEKLDAMLFYHAKGREMASTVCEIELVDQSQVLVRKIERTDSAIVALAVCGTKMEIPFGSIVRMNFALGRDVILSNISPTTNDWQPLMTSSAIVDKLRRLKLARVNESFSGQPLSLKFHSQSGLSFLAKTKQFENGFAIQSGGKLAFAVNGQYSRLSGLVGFDPSANPSGDVLFKVLVDGKIVVENEMRNREMENPIELDLDIKNANRIVFQVDFHDGRSTGDQLHMVNLKVSQ